MDRVTLEMLPPSQRRRSRWSSVVVQPALPQALFEPNPLEGCLWEPPVTWKGSRWACSRAGAMSSQTCPGQLQATTLLFKGFIKE